VIRRGLDVEREVTVIGKGELVWAKIPTIRPGPGSTIAVGIQEIDYWPAIVTEPVLKVHADAGEPGTIMQSTQYSLRYCGRLDQVSGEGPHKTTATLNETEILPWHMYSPTRPELGAVAKKYALSVAEASITLNNGESAEEKRVKSWRRETIQRAWPIAEAIKPDNWERMVTIYTEALVLANEMSMLWSQTDPYSHMDNIPFKHDFLADKSYFQVRLCCPLREPRGDTMTSLTHNDLMMIRACGGEPNESGWAT